MPEELRFMVGRPLTEDEIERLKQSGPGEIMRPEPQPSDAPALMIESATAKAAGVVELKVFGSCPKPFIGWSIAVGNARDEVMALEGVLSEEIKGRLEHKHWHVWQPYSQSGGEPGAYWASFLDVRYAYREGGNAGETNQPLFIPELTHLLTVKYRVKSDARPNDCTLLLKDQWFRMKGFPKTAAVREMFSTPEYEKLPAALTSGAIKIVE